MKALLLLLAVSCAVLSAVAARGQGFDRLGAPVVQLPDLFASPATVVATGWFLRGGMSVPFTDAGITEQRLYGHRSGTRAGIAVQLERQGSDIHARTTLGAALQVRGVAGTLGLAGALQQWSFAEGPTRQRWHAQLAWGRNIGPAAMLALQVRPPVARDDRIALDLLLSSAHLAPFHLVFREQRIAGFPVMRQFGVVWSDTRVSLRAGYNDATMATSIGIALWTGPWSWDASASVHPLLGYGRQWGLALSH